LSDQVDEGGATSPLLRSLRTPAVLSTTRCWWSASSAARSTPTVAALRQFAPRPASIAARPRRRGDRV